MTLWWTDCWLALCLSSLAGCTWPTASPSLVLQSTSGNSQPMKEWSYTVMTSSSSARDPFTTPASSSTFINYRNLTDIYCSGQFSIHTGVNCVCVSNEGRGRKFGNNRWLQICTRHFSSKHFSPIQMPSLYTKHSSNITEKWNVERESFKLAVWAAAVAEPCSLVLFCVHHILHFKGSGLLRCTMLNKSLGTELDVATRSSVSCPDPLGGLKLGRGTRLRN